MSVNLFPPCPLDSTAINFLGAGTSPGNKKGTPYLSYVALPLSARFVAPSRVRVFGITFPQANSLELIFTSDLQSHVDAACLLSNAGGVGALDGVNVIFDPSGERVSKNGEIVSGTTYHPSFYSRTPVADVCVTPSDYTVTGTNLYSTRPVSVQPYVGQAPNQASTNFQKVNGVFRWFFTQGFAWNGSDESPLNFATPPKTLPAATINVGGFSRLWLLAASFTGGLTGTISGWCVTINGVEYCGSCGCGGGLSIAP